MQAISAYFLGVNGFALALPQALAGVLSIPLIYLLIKRPFGTPAGILAALALATTPVTISTERNNTIDGLLLFVLLLAAWAFLQAVYDNRFRYLLLGSFLVGVGFNIKMMQAFLPLPAFYAIYLFGTSHTWRKRIAHLIGATILLIIVSLSWAIVVDLTPPDQRPFIGSSHNNTVMELIIGHNGFNRLVGGGGPGGPPPPNIGPPGQFPPPNAGPPGRFPPPGGQRPPGPPGSGETGNPGPLRLFVRPLVTEASWLLPLALLGIPIVLFCIGNPFNFAQDKRFEFTEQHVALTLWAGWLITEVIFFSVAAFFHAYYLIMLGPPIAALISITAWAIWQIIQYHRWQGWLLMVLLVGLTVIFQLVTLWQTTRYPIWIAVVSVIALLTGLGIFTLVAMKNENWLDQVVLSIAFVSLMIIPLTWSSVTTFNSNPDVMLPRSGPSTGQPPRPDAVTKLSPMQQAILDYLLAHATPGTYLVATPSAHEASSLILNTQRPVLTFGGFNGGDNVIDADRLAQMVESGKLRFVLGGEQLSQQKPDIGSWLTTHCTIVPFPNVPSDAPPARPHPNGGPPQPKQAETVYDCNL
jgi:4-amino-4-deoxy-L-arabinose transferase-like glycosyltransferase